MTVTVGACTAKMLPREIVFEVDRLALPTEKPVLSISRSVAVPDTPSFGNAADAVPTVTPTVSLPSGWGAIVNCRSVALTPEKRPSPQGEGRIRSYPTRSQTQRRGHPGATLTLRGRMTVNEATS